MNCLYLCCPRLNQNCLKLWLGNDRLESDKECPGYRVLQNVEDMSNNPKLSYKWALLLNPRVRVHLVLWATPSVLVSMDMSEDANVSMLCESEC